IVARLSSRAADFRISENGSAKLVRIAVLSIRWRLPPGRNRCRSRATQTWPLNPSRPVEEPMVAPVLIKENMEVLGSDGINVGFVDHLAGPDAVMLSRDDPDAGGEPPEVPLSWVKHVGMKIHLNQPAEEAKARWTRH